MSDKRRRRRRASGDSSGGEEEDEASITASDHEYESAAEDSALEDSEDDEKDKNVSKEAKEEDEGVVDLPSDNEEQAVWEEERGAGDGQEEKDGKVDDDEDRRNPQYIPKKGMFYEHDDRIDSEPEGEGGETSASKEAAASTDQDKPRRVPRSEKIDKWGHDKFLEREQAPKTREELVSVYGYDIRNEDSAPRARRRRRYGRGPNKYTRNWEDEKAYEAKSASEKPPRAERGERAERGSERGRGGRGGGGSDRGGQQRKSNGKLRLDDKEQFPAIDSKKDDAVVDISNKAKEERKNINNTPRGGRGGGGGSTTSSTRGGKSSKNGNKSDYSANQRLQKEPRPVVEQPQKSSRSNNSNNEKVVEAKLDKLEISKKEQPKRYSNSRQRGGGEPRSNGNNQRQPRDVYPNEVINGNASNSANSNSQNTSNNFVNAANFPTNASGPPPAAPFLAASGVPAAAAAAAAAAAGTPTSTSGFLDPSAMVNYGPPPPVQFTPVAVPVTVTVPLVSVPGAAAGAPHDTLAVLAPPLPNVTSPEQVLLAAAAANQGYAEVRGGVTYFNPTAQAPVMARPVSKRPKAAIPIVDPSQVTSTVSPQSSTEDAEEHIEAVTSSSNNKAGLLQTAT